MSAYTELISSQLWFHLQGCQARGRQGPLSDEGRMGKEWGALLCCVQRCRRAVLWLLAHEFRCSACIAGLGTFPKSLLPYLLHHWLLMKLARVLAAAWMEKENSPQRGFYVLWVSCLCACPSSGTCCKFLHPTDNEEFLLHKTLRPARYRDVKMKNCVGNKSYRTESCYLLDLLGGTISLFWFLD